MFFGLFVFAVCREQIVELRHGHAAVSFESGFLTELKVTIKFFPKQWGISHGGQVLPRNVKGGGVTQGGRLAILGAGMAGLSLAYFLAEGCEILEKSASAGGLCRSFQKNGLTYDLGGHVIFSSDQEILSLELDLLANNTKQHERKNCVWFDGRAIKYPFENNLHALSKDDAFDCLWSFLNNPQRQVSNLEDWIYNNFGRGIAEKYLLPYNEKIWKMPPNMMACDWISRIPKPPTKDIVKSAIGIETEGNLEQLHFHYPAQGGFQALPDAIRSRLKVPIVGHFEIVSIEKEKNAWIISDGKTERSYEQIVSTIPLPSLIKTLKNVPAEVQTAAANLVHNALIVVMLVARKNRSQRNFGIYFPQPDLLFHRVCFYDFFQSGDHHTASPVVAEITCRVGDDIWKMTDEEIISRVKTDLAREGFIELSDIEGAQVQRAPFAYVVFDLHTKSNLSVVNNFLDEQSIHRCGRFAEFRYINSDAVMRSAKNLAAKIKGIIV